MPSPGQPQHPLPPNCIQAYLALAALSIAIAARRLFALGLPDKETLTALALAGSLLAHRTDIDVFIKFADDPQACLTNLS